MVDKGMEGSRMHSGSEEEKHFNTFFRILNPVIQFMRRFY